MKKIFTPLFLLLPFFLFAQGEGNIWYFGHNAGINFNSGSAVAISGPVNTNEGCATICNSAGALLFSTDGITVYNANNVSMGTGLWGNPSTTQSFNNGLNNSTLNVSALHAGLYFVEVKNTDGSVMLRKQFVKN